MRYFTQLLGKTMLAVLVAGLGTALPGCTGSFKKEAAAGKAVGEVDSPGERMSRVSSKMNLMTQQWNEGKKQIDEGRVKVDKGRALMDEGQEMIGRGEEMQRKSEEFFDEHGGSAP